MVISLEGSMEANFSRSFKQLHESKLGQLCEDGLFQAVRLTTNRMASICLANGDRDRV